MAELKDDCLFCRIIRGELPSTKEYESDTVIGIRDIMPRAKEHVLFIPKKHISTLNEVTAEDWPLMTEMLQAARQTAEKLGITESGYRVVNNCNQEGGQEVYHIHFHLLGGEQLRRVNG